MVAHEFRKGIILAGGTGSRLYPITLAVNKHLLPVYDRPLVYFPLSVLMLCGIQEILLICGAEDVTAFQRLLGNGNHLGLSIEYAVQSEPRGIADAFRIGESFIDSENIALVLGDNIFFGAELEKLLERAAIRNKGATVFTCPVDDPPSYGILELDKNGKPISLEEKPCHPRSNLAVTGLYFYDHQVVDLARKIKPSHRGELEITDINSEYLERGMLQAEILPEGVTWLDAGTPKALLRASEIAESAEGKEHAKIACVEEIAFRNGFITQEDFELSSASIPGDYGEYLRKITVSGTV